MTETDNQKVKDHIETERSQLIRSIDQLGDPERPFQKMFESREIKPVVLIGRYNRDTKKYEISQIKQTVLFSTVSAATYTITCPANTRYHVKYFAGRDDTSATFYSLTGTINGQAITFLPTSLSASDVGQIAILIGNNTFLAVGGLVCQAITGPITLNPGDTLVMTMVNYVALDDTEYVAIVDEEVI